MENVSTAGTWPKQGSVMAGMASRGLAWCGEVWSGAVRNGAAWQAWLGEFWQVMVGLGLVRRGEAWFGRRRNQLARAWLRRLSFPNQITTQHKQVYITYLTFKDEYGGLM